MNLNGHWEMVIMLREWSRRVGVVFDEDQADAFVRQYWPRRLVELGSLDRLPGGPWCHSAHPRDTCRCWVCRAGGLDALPWQAAPTEQTS